MFGCLMTHFMMDMRNIAVKAFARICFVPSKSKSIISIEKIQRQLALDDRNDAINCMQALGFELEEDDTFTISKRENEEKWSSTVKKFR
jgi:hypothetical protein